MKYRTMGRTGYKVSEIGFGAWQIGGGSWGAQSDKDSTRALAAAIEKGVNFIDTAAGYGNGKIEKIVGKFTKDVGKRIYIATKTPPLPGTWLPSLYSIAEDRYPEGYIRSNVNERLKNLDLDGDGIKIGVKLI